MRRFSFLAVLALALVALAVVGRSPGTAAQDGTPAAGLAGHPLVGTWIVSGPDVTPAIATFGADGIVVDVEIDTTFAGTWEVTGPQTAATTFGGFYVDSGFGASVIIRATIEVDATGDAFTADYSYTAVGADGTVLDSGTGTVTGTRMGVEPVEAAGTPLAGMPTWTVPTDEGEAATPAATPAA
jgi:hypothetical protein